MTTIFTKIINGEIPCHKIDEDGEFFAFLDIRPVQRGHTLVIPKVEVDKFFECDDDVMSKIMVFSKRVANAIEKSVECNRVAVIVAGLEVPHAHVHLIPFSKMGELSFGHAHNVESEELSMMAEKIISNL